MLTESTPFGAVFLRAGAQTLIWQRTAEVPIVQQAYLAGNLKGVGSHALEISLGTRNRTHVTVKYRLYFIELRQSPPVVFLNVMGTICRTPYL
jgi:hypothetical protein